MSEGGFMKFLYGLLLCFFSTMSVAGEWVLPVAARIQGNFETNWMTDLYILTDGQPHDVTLVFMPSSANGLAVRDVQTITVNHRVEIVSNVLETVFSETNSFGWLIVESESENLRFSSRTYNVVDKGSYGQLVPAMKMASFLGGQALLLPGARQNDQFRTNLGLVNLGSNIGTAMIKGYNQQGLEVFSFSHSMLPLEHRQFDSVFAEYHSLNLDAGYITITTSVGNPVTAYISVVDKESGDAIFIPGAPLGSNSENFLLPVATHAPGGYQTFWQTDIWALNPGAQSAVLNLSMGDKTVQKTVESQNLIPIRDVVFKEFGESEMTDSIWCSVSPASPLQMISRTYTSEGLKTYGQQVPFLDLDRQEPTGNSSVLFPVIKNGVFRTNFGVVNFGDQTLSLTMTLEEGSGELRSSEILTVEPGQLFRITDLPGYFGLTGILAGALKLESDGAPYTAFISIVDNGTGDAIFIPVQEPIQETTGELADFAFTKPEGWEDRVILAYRDKSVLNTMLVSGQPTYLSFGVINNGLLAAAVDVNVLIDGNVVSSLSSGAALNPGEIYLFRDANLDISNGLHQLSLVLDPNGTVPENNESNNIYTSSETWVPSVAKVDMGHVTPPGWVAPLIVNYALDDHNLATLTGNTVAYVHWVIKNYLNQEVTIPFEVQLFLNGTMIGEWVSDETLGGGGLWMMDNVPLSLEGGTQVFSVNIDPYKRLWESHTSDNLFTNNVFVGASFFKHTNLIPYIPEGWDYPIIPSSQKNTHKVGGFLPKNSPTYIDIAIKNDGTKEITTPFDVALSVDNVIVQTWTVTDLNDGEIFSVDDFSYTFTPGQHELGLRADINGTVDELNEGDNYWSMSFTW